MTIKRSRRGDVAPFIVMSVMSAAAEYERKKAEKALHLEVGQPGTPAPLAVREAAHRAIDTSLCGYTLTVGLPALRERIARFYDETYGEKISPEQVIITTGSSAGFILTFLACFDQGDRIAMVEPGYPAYRNILRALGYEPIGIPAGPDTRYQPTPELLDTTGERIDGLIVASPSNPAGTMLDAHAMSRLADWSRERGVRLISDEIYHGITYGGPALTMASFSEDAIIVNSFSKYFSMTGWRIGWLVLPRDMVDSVDRLAQNLFISTPTLSQEAAIAAFDALDEANSHVARYARNREILLEALPKAGITEIAPPDGAFYLYCDISHLTGDSVTFCEKMLEETGVAATPGVDFDPDRGGQTIRFSFAGPTEDIQEAARRMIEWIPGRGAEIGRELAREQN